jgi:hypothetical protein
LEIQIGGMREVVLAIATSACGEIRRVVMRAMFRSVSGYAFRHSVAAHDDWAPSGAARLSAATV